MNSFRSVAVGALAASVAALAAVSASAAPRIVDVSERAGIDDVAHTWGAETGDIDGDGLEDLLVINHYQPEPRSAYLYRNEGDGTFSKVNTGPNTFTKRDRHDCAFGDVNRDGLEDIYCTIGGGRGSGNKPNELYMQQPDGTFVDEANEFGVVDVNGRGRDTTFIDVNNDGFLDLYVGNKFPRTDNLKSKNKLYINVDGERFRDARDYGVNRQVGGKIVQRVDYNNDGFDDLMVCGERHVFLYRNEAGERFTNVSRQAGIDVPCEGALMARMNGGADEDLVVVTKTRLTVLHQRAGERFEVVHERRIRGGTEVAAGPVNGDSRPDLYVVQRGAADNDAPDLMLLNQRGGRDFRSVDMPQTRRGKGDYVTSFDYNQNGREDFVVLNGFHKHPGPVRLLATRTGNR
jgi:hypothetical protein